MPRRVLESLHYSLPDFQANEVALTIAALALFAHVIPILPLPPDKNPNLKAALNK